MHFTLVFGSHESYDLSLSLTFEPCPMWRRGGALVLNPHPDFPAYRDGDFVAAMQVLGADFSEGLMGNPHSALVVIHDNGHGTEHDLQLLMAELERCGFQARKIRLTL